MTTVYVMRELDHRADFILRSGAKGKNEARVKVEFGDLANNVSSQEKDIAYVAAALFALEELHNTDKNFKLGEWVKFLVSSELWNSREVKQLLHEIFSYATRCSVTPQFDVMLPATQSKTMARLNSVCLFSGGIDSLCGVLSLPANLKPSAGLFVNHTNLIGVVDTIAPDIEAKGLRIHTLSVQRSKTDIQQLRGFLYLCFGSILSKLSGTDTIVISETGPTMYQPRYLPSDEVTLTTNPFLLELTKGLVERVLGFKLRIYEPFEDMTKAEAMAICSAKNLIKLTNSCITSRFVHDQFPHCGHCLGCVVRRLSALVAGVEDSAYAWDVAMMSVGERIVARRSPTHSAVTEHDMNDLLMLFRFARGMLADGLPDYTRSSIQEYGKEPLFRRFAMDILAATHVISARTRNQYVKKFYKECISDSIVTRDELEERIADVTEGKAQPNFNPRVF